MSGGGLFLDYDNDGWQDLLLVDGGSVADAEVAGRARHRLFRYRDAGALEDVTTTAGLGHPRYGMGACAADYDNDGWIDVYVTSVGPNLNRNNGGRHRCPVRGRRALRSSVRAAPGPTSIDGDVDSSSPTTWTRVTTILAASAFRVYTTRSTSRRPIGALPQRGNSTFVARAARWASSRAATALAWCSATTTTTAAIFVANDDAELPTTGRKTFREVAPGRVSVASDGIRAPAGQIFRRLHADGR
jgi:hypothetical protein